jgi:DNA-binding CsgD family transcriptional regulator/PAS domain-containing protein
MVTVDDFSRLVSAIYSAAITPEHWDVAIAETHRTFDGTVGALVLAQGAHRSIKTSSIEPDAARTYKEYYGRVDPVILSVEGGPVGAVRTGTELIVPHVRSEFYADYLRRYDLGEGVFALLTAAPRRTSLVVAAPKRSEPFDTAERVTLMSRLVPHLQQALRIEDRLTAVTQRSGDLAGALELVRHGIVIVGPGYRVINLNSAAERILRIGDDLHTRSGRLAATRPHADRELHRLLNNALTEEGLAIRSGGSFTCARASGHRPYVIHVLPLDREVTTQTSAGEAAMLLIVDPERDAEPAAALLRRLYGLTNTEAEVALLLLRCEGLKPIAEELSVSLTTIRTHLQHIFDKTDTHRQAQLVRLLLAISP